MKYIKITIFEKYHISTRLSKEEIKDYLKNDDSVVKDYLLFEELNNIENEEYLFQHELFTVNDDHGEDEILQRHQKILKSFYQITQTRQTEGFEEFLNDLTIFLTYESIDKVFYHGSTLSISSKKQAVRQFVMALLVELVDNVLFEYENISTPYFEKVISLINYFDLVICKNHYLKDRLESGLVNMIQSAINWFEDISTMKGYMEYICSIPEAALQNSELYHTLLAFIDNLIAHFENRIIHIALIEYYICLLKMIKGEDAYQRATVIVKLIDCNLDVRANEKDVNLTIFDNGTKLIANFKYYNANFHQENNGVDLNSLKEKICFLRFILNHPQEWYKRYFILTKTLKLTPSAEQVYQWVKHLVSSKLPELFYNHAGTILMELTGFDKMVDSFEKRRIRTCEVIKSAPDKIKTGYALYHNMVNLLEKAFITSSEIDVFISRYYSLVYLKDYQKYLTLFNEVKQLAFLNLKVLDELPFIDTKSEDDFIIKVLKDSPEDWFYQDQKVGHYFRKQYNYETNQYGISTASKYQALYNELFSHRKNVVLRKVEEVKTNESDYHSINRKLNFITMVLYETDECEEAWVLKHHFYILLNKNIFTRIYVNIWMWHRELLYRMNYKKAHFREKRRNAVDAFVKKLIKKGISTAPFVENVENHKIKNDKK